MGSIYVGITLNWHYANGYVFVSMPGYIAKMLKNFGHRDPTRSEHAPYTHVKPNYGSKVHLTFPEDRAAPLPPKDVKRPEQISGSLLFYRRAIDSSLLTALGTLTSAQMNATTDTGAALTKIINYCASNPVTVIHFHKIGMVLYVSSDASYLSKPKARRCASGHFYLSSNPKDTHKAPTPKDTMPPMNGAIHAHNSIMGNVLSSAMEADMGSLYENLCNAEPIRVSLE